MAPLSTIVVCSANNSNDIDPTKHPTGEDQGAAQAVHQQAAHGATKRHSHSKAITTADGTIA